VCCDEEIKTKLKEKDARLRDYSERMSFLYPASLSLWRKLTRKQYTIDFCIWYLLGEKDDDWTFFP